MARWATVSSPLPKQPLQKGNPPPPPERKVPREERGNTHSSVNETSPCNLAFNSNSTSRFSPSCNRTGFVSARRGSTAGFASPPPPFAGANALLLLFLFRRRRRDPREPTDEAPSEFVSESFFALLLVFSEGWGAGGRDGYLASEVSEELVFVRAAAAAGGSREGGGLGEGEGVHLRGGHWFFFGMVVVVDGEVREGLDDGVG